MLSESCEIYIKPHVAWNLIQVDVALERHSGMPLAGGICCPRAAQNIYISAKFWDIVVAMQKRERS